MEKRIFLLTGAPGVGKTTVLLKIVEILKSKGYSVGGMVSREVRSCGTRIGFEVLDLFSLRRGWLAHVNQKFGPKVGKYRVNVEDLNNVGVNAIANAVRDADVIVIDEIGPMELFSEKFKQVVRVAVNSEKPLVSIVHWKARDKLIDEVKAREDAEIYNVNLGNKDELNAFIAEKIAGLLKK
ncbi:MAG: NTPase [Candidatus Bathyarchaeia archaeon]|nr:MAG: nucleoside triphosphatase [Candidatus Bathyarchaeota archaeon]